MTRNEDLLKAVNELLKETISKETEEAVAHRCLEFARELSGSEYGFIGKINREYKMDTIAMSDMAFDACKIETDRKEPTKLLRNMTIRCVWGAVIKSEKPFYTNDVPNHPDSSGVPEGHPEIYNFLGVPLMYGRRIVGVIALANREGGYDDDCLETIIDLSTSFSLVLRKKEEEIQLRKYQKHLEELLDIQSHKLLEVELLMERVFDEGISKLSEDSKTTKESQEKDLDEIKKSIENMRKNWGRNG